MIRRLCMVAALGIATSAQPSHAIENGMATRLPVAASAAAAVRQALIVAPAPGGGAMATDADSYESLLRLLGFSVTTVVSETRPELEGDLRRFAAAVKPGGEVALILLGTLPAKGDRLYLTPTAPAPDLTGRPELLATEGVSVSDLLQRIGERGPKDIVAIVDTCRAAEGTSDCRLAAAALPEGVSALVASRRRGTDAGRPLARLASLRPDLVQLMQQPDLSFFALYALLTTRLFGTDTTLSATPTLSRSFAFLPGDFLGRLPTSCNRIETTDTPASLRGRRLDEIAVACAEAARTYAFSPYFANKLAIVQAAQQAMARDEAARVRSTSGEDDARKVRVASAAASKICVYYLRDYFAQWSSPNKTALAFVRSAYAPTVDYYGQPHSQADVVEDKVNFASRWPVRDYSVVSGRFDLLDEGRCEIKGVVSWKATRPASKPIKGLSDFDFIISLERNPVIVSETSKVLSKDP